MTMPSDLSLDTLERSRIGPLFRSKKNRVFKSDVGGKAYIVKVYRGEWRERASIEYELLKECRARDVPVPEPVALLEGAIVMVPVSGIVVGDEFDRMIVLRSGLVLTSEQERLADSLARWLTKFHLAFGLRRARGDTILRNFIINDEGVVGLDFEESSPSDTISDLGQLCASVLMTDPVFTERKIAFARHLADRYWTCSGQRRSGELGGAIASSIRHYAQYRANGQELLAYASKIENGSMSI